MLRCMLLLLAAFRKQPMFVPRSQDTAVRHSSRMMMDADTSMKLNLLLFQDTALTLLELHNMVKQHRDIQLWTEC